MGDVFITSEKKEGIRNGKWGGGGIYLILLVLCIVIYIHWYFNPKSSIHFILYNPRWSVSSWHCVCPFNKNSYLTLSSEFWSWWIFFIYLDSQRSYHDFCFIKSEDEDEEMESEEEEEEDDEEEEEESSPEKK